MMESVPAEKGVQDNIETQSTNLEQENETVAKPEGASENDGSEVNNTEKNVSEGATSHAEKNVSEGATSHAEKNVSEGATSHAEKNVSEGATSHAEKNVSEGATSHAEKNVSEGATSHAECVKDIEEALKQDVLGKDEGESTSLVADKEMLPKKDNVLEKDSDQVKKIKKKDVSLPKGFKGKLAFVLYNVLSKEECEKLIARTEEMGYEQALLNAGFGRQVLRTDVRNSSRAIWDSFEEADTLFQRIKQYIPEKWAGRKVVALNERLRFLRYHPGEYFKPHFDGTYMRENGERSYITIQMYLNEGFKGGSTTFMDMSEKQRVEVVPKTGSVLIFEHNLYHEGSELRKGVKYSMRTDVMFDSYVSK